ncbi:MAG: nucleotidyltransferase domain-containing protein [Sterolibacterium sp.]|nr:nucleotidyltransferase domain-containing protein [Sterolibacterium sp.]
MTSFGLSDQTLATVRAILGDHPEIEEAILYGSRAKGTHSKGSDIDLTLVGAGLDHHLLAQIAGRLEDSTIPYQVDLSLKCDIDNPDLLAHIERVGVVFYRKGESKEVLVA